MTFFTCVGLYRNYVWVYDVKYVYIGDLVPSFQNNLGYVIVIERKRDLEARSTLIYC